MSTSGENLCRGEPEPAPAPEPVTAPEPAASRRDLFATLPTALVRVIFEFVLPTDTSVTLTLTGHLREQEMGNASNHWRSKWLETNHPKFGELMLGEEIIVKPEKYDDRTDFYQEKVSWSWNNIRKYSGDGFHDSVDRFSLLEATASVGAVCKSFNRLLQTFPFVLSYVARLRFLASFKACWEAKAELDVWSIDMGDIFQREPFGPPPVPVAVCPPEHAEMAAYLAQTADGDPYRTNASINNNPPYFVAQLLCLPQQTAFSRVSMCCFDIDLWITILADELAKREADTDKVFTREIEIGSPCRLQSSNDSHPWYSNQYLSQASHEAFVKIDDFMLARAASPDDYDMILPLVCRECRGVDTYHSENHKRTNFIRRENECEHCHAPIGRAMARVCFDSCSDKIGRLCSCLQPTEGREYVDPDCFPDNRGRDCCGMVCAACLPKLQCKKCNDCFFSKFCPNHKCVKKQERPIEYFKGFLFEDGYEGF